MHIKYKNLQLQHLLSSTKHQRSYYFEKSKFKQHDLEPNYKYGKTEKAKSIFEI